MYYSMKSDKKWEKAVKKGKCVEGCKLEKGMCEHLEKYLDNYTRTRVSIGVARFYSIDDFQELQKEEYNGDTTELEGKLIAIGLCEDEVEIVLSRLIDDFSFRDLEEKLGYVHPEATRRFYLMTLEKIRTRLRRKRGKD